MHIKVVNYAPSASPLVQAFVDVELDGWLRFNGLNFDRDGGLRSAQLTATHNGKRSYLSAKVVMDADLRELLASDILEAIRAHVAGLPPEERTRPPRPPTMQPPEKSANGKKALPPPRRLLIAMKGARP